MTEQKISFIPIKQEEIKVFKEQLQEAFAVAVIEHFGSLEDGPIPPDEDIDESIQDKNAETYYIMADGIKVGGVVLSINKETNHNEVGLLFIMPKYHGKGLGTKIWRTIEKKYPETEVWELGTPYFEKRNIHFYVNKCGFHIVEFYNKYHPDPHMPEVEEDGFFRFEKRMKKCL